MVLVGLATVEIAVIGSILSFFLAGGRLVQSCPSSSSRAALFKSARGGSAQSRPFVPLGTAFDRFALGNSVQTCPRATRWAESYKLAHLGCVAYKSVFLARSHGERSHGVAVLIITPYSQYHHTVWSAALAAAFKVTSQGLVHFSSESDLNCKLLASGHGCREPVFSSFKSRLVGGGVT